MQILHLRSVRILPDPDQKLITFDNLTVESLSLYAVFFPNSNILTEYISSLSNLRELFIKNSQQLNERSLEKIFSTVGSNLNHVKIVGDSSDIICKLISTYCCDIQKLELNFQEISVEFQKISENNNIKRNLQILHLKSSLVSFNFSPFYLNYY